MHIMSKRGGRENCFKLSLKTIAYETKILIIHTVNFTTFRDKRTSDHVKFLPQTDLGHLGLITSQ
jgi:hypothetical protein